MLLLTGLLIVTIEVWLCRTNQSHPPARYVAIPLGERNSQPVGQGWTEVGLAGCKKLENVKAIGTLLALLLLAICGRIGIFYLIMKNVECTGPSPGVRP